MTCNAPVLAAPFPYFGGKRTVAAVVWQGLGDVEHYVEPFFGSGAVLLARPHAPRIETVNDMDGFVVNFWRAVAAEPEAVAEAMNGPVNEVDLEARHRWLCRMPDKADFLARMKREPALYDVRRAAWWCWGLCAWIGRRWCAGEYWPDAPERSHGRGVCEGANKRPRLGRSRGVHRQLPHLGNAGRGVHRQLPHLGNADQGECARRGAVLRDWMLALADRLRNVRVCCGDWSRICTDGATSHGRTVGVFLDPPYSGEANREAALYREEDLAVAHAVRAWCVAHTDRPRFRIAICGYEGEHDELESMGWRVHAWRTHGGFANFGKQNERGKANRGRERIWFSPQCLAGPADAPLFEGE